MKIMYLSFWGRPGAVPAGFTATAPAAVDEVVEGEGDEAAVVAHHRGVANHLKAHQQANIDYSNPFHSLPSYIQHKKKS